MNNNNINAFWYRGNNFGDELVPYIINKLSDKDVTWVDAASNIPKYIVIGSILDWGIKNATVWGCGVMHSNKHITGTDFHAVRGNVTKDLLLSQGHNCDDIALGDPALIMPYLYNPSVIKKYKIGIFAHFIDSDDVTRRNDSGYFIINPLDDRETVIKDVLSCDVIVSSSLHGLIIADAYGIKNRWVKFGNRLSGDDSKFHDYYQSIDFPNETFIDMRGDVAINLNNIDYIDKKIPYEIVPNLIHSCPFITDRMRDTILDRHGADYLL